MGEGDVTDELVLSDDVALPLDIVTQVTGVCGISGSGKSNTTMRVVEQVHAAGVPVTIIDPKPDTWGVRLSADGEGPGLPFVIIGGDRADIPLEPTAAYAQSLARLINDNRMSVIVDISDLDDDEERTAFVAPFLLAMLKVNSEIRLVVIEELEEIAPEPARPGTMPMIRAVSKIAKTGRTKGLGMLLTFQRAASVSKQPFAMIKVLIAMMTTYERDKKRIDEWGKDHETTKREIVSSLPGLAAGEGWVIAPIYKLVARTRFHRRATFDSGATPTVGQVIRRDMPASVDVGAIAAALSSLVQEIESEDPDVLLAKIAVLERQLAEVPETSVVQEMVPYIPPDVTDAVQDFTDSTIATLNGTTIVLADALQAFDNVLETLRDSRDRLVEKEEAIRRATEQAQAITDDRTPIPTPVGLARPVPADQSGGGRHGRAQERRVAPKQPTERPRAPRGRAPRSDAVPGASSSQLKAGARRMAEVLVRYYPEPLTRFEVSTLAHVSKGGTLSEYARSLLDGGLASEEDGAMRPTPAALEMFPDVEGQRYTTKQIVEMYDGDLKAGARRMLDELLAAWPNGLTRAVLSQQANVSKGGTLSEYARSLLKRGLAEETRGAMFASKVLYKR